MVCCVVLLLQWEKLSKGGNFHFSCVSYMWNECLLQSHSYLLGFHLLVLCYLSFNFLLCVTSESFGVKGVCILQNSLLFCTWGCPAVRCLSQGPWFWSEALLEINVLIGSYWLFQYCTSQCKFNCRAWVRGEIWGQCRSSGLRRYLQREWSFYDIYALVTGNSCRKSQSCWLCFKLLS